MANTISVGTAADVAVATLYERLGATNLVHRDFSQALVTAKRDYGKAAADYRALHAQATTVWTAEGLTAAGAAPPPPPPAGKPKDSR